MVTIKFKWAILILYSLILTQAIGLVLFITFLIAYSSPLKCVTVYINNYGESVSELCILSVIFILSMVSTVYMVALLHRRKG